MTHNLLYLQVTPIDKNCGLVAIYNTEPEFTSRSPTIEEPHLPMNGIYGEVYEECYLICPYDSVMIHLTSQLKTFRLNLGIEKQFNYSGLVLFSVVVVCLFFKL